jgi:broad specificity phosphatase PhoE
MDGQLIGRRQALSGLAGLCASAYLPSSWATTGSDTASSGFWQRAREGGCILLMRHGVTVAGVGDPPNFRLGDCSTQRNLSEAGREASRQLGKRFVAERIPLASVYSSAWCRCLDTARLAFDPHYPAHQIWPALNSFFQGQGDRERQTREVLLRAATLRAPANWMLVTHQVNITALTGTVPAMGEVFLTRFDPAQPERLTLLERLGP